MMLGWERIEKLTSKVVIAGMLSISALAFAGSDVGNGGDLVKCVPSSANSLFGLYSLDYLIFSQGKVPQPIAVGSWQESIFRIRRVFVDKLPELLPVFDDFVNNILNQDQSRHQVWEPTDYELKEIDDEDLPSSVSIPINCRENGKIQLIQAVIRQNPEFTGSKLIVYKYMPRIFEKTATEKPLQLSFLLVHEFLWSISTNVDRNRRINWFLHSEEIQNLSRLDVIDRLLGMGLNIKEIPRILDASGRGHFSSLQDALAQARDNETIIVKEGNYTTGGSAIVRPMRLIGEGDRTKIIIKSGRSYPALEINLEDNQSLHVENLTLSRVFNADDEDVFYSSDVFRVSSGNLLMNKVTVRGSGGYAFRLLGQENIKIDDSDFESYKAMKFDYSFKGHLRVTNSRFLNRWNALRIDAARPRNIYFEGNIFRFTVKPKEACPISIDLERGGDGKIKKGEFEMALKFFQPFFKNNIYETGGDGWPDSLCQL